MATIRERKPGVWEVRVFVGNDDSGRPRQVSRTVRGTKRDALRGAAELTVAPPAASDGRTVADALDAWIETHTPTWAASTVRDQTSRASLVKADHLARMPLGRLTVADVDRWHTRLRAAGVGESSVRNQHLVLRAAMSQPPRSSMRPRRPVPSVSCASTSARWQLSRRSAGSASATARGCSSRGSVR